MFQIEILWEGKWVAVQGGFATRDEAEWATAGWKQKNECYADPFRVSLSSEAAHVADPNYVPTLDEMLRHPDAFVAGMTETSEVHHGIPPHLLPPGVEIAE